LLGCGKRGINTQLSARTTRRNILTNDPLTAVQPWAAVGRSYTRGV
jgi:hypothetical protein